MSVLADVNQKRKTSMPQGGSKKISVAQKRWLLAIHLVFVASWLGGGLAALAVNLAVLNTNDPHLLNSAYVFADTLEKTVIRGGAGGTLLTGILLALLTQWGLLKFYWIIATEILSILTVVTDFFIQGWNTHVIALTAAQGAAALADPTYLSTRSLLFVGIVLQLILLALSLGVNVFKPWGPRKRAVTGQPQPAREKSLTDA